MEKIYLAGPDVFRANAFEHFENIKKLCKKYGFEGLSPFDNENFNGELFSKAHSTNIFLSNVDLIKKCEFIIANLIPFRGACIDDGTAWEIAMAYSLDKVIYGYTPYYNVRLPHQIKMDNYPDNLSEFPNVESFGNNCVNLMIQESIEISGGKILKDFEKCLIDIRV